VIVTAHIERTYRRFINDRIYSRYTVKISETDLYILTDSDLHETAYHSALGCRAQIEEYIRYHPEFKTSLIPLPIDDLAPEIIKEMLEAAKTAGVGPMASVAGAIAEHVGKDLLAYSLNVIVENGGDIYLNIKDDISIGIFAGDSPLSGRIALRITAAETPLGVCTSSGTVGHSLSFGVADAVCIKSESAALADAAATSVGNLIRKKSDVKKGLDRAMAIKGVLGVLIVTGDTLAIQGSMELRRA
jgi:ApbE superfamily uncharacterized protein (UPF0280 family)